MKLNAQITSWLNVGANINFQNRTDGDIATNWESQILDNSPFTSPYNENGELVPHPMGEATVVIPIPPVVDASRDYPRTP